MSGYFWGLFCSFQGAGEVQGEEVFEGFGIEDAFGVTARSERRKERLFSGCGSGSATLFQDSTIPLFMARQIPPDLS